MELFSPSLHNQGSKPVSGDFQVPFLRFPGSLLEGVKHVDALHELRNIEDSMFEFGVDTNLPTAGIGFQSFGSSPCWTRRSWNPATRRASGGKPLRSLREDPSQKSDLSGTV